MSTALVDPQESTFDAQEPGSDTLAASVVLLLGMTVLQRLIGFGRGVLFCRWLDPEQLGQWDVAFGFLNLAAPLAVLGLPGSFGRYFEYFRARGQVRTFLCRTTLVCAITAGCAVGAIAAARAQFSQLIFGTADRGELVLWITAALGAVIVQNFVVCVFMAARRYRVVTAIQFCQSLLFAVASIGLCSTWQPTAASAVVGFGLSSLVCAAAAYPWLRPIWHTSGRREAAVPQSAFWAKLLPFAAWVWLTNLLANLFEVIDRYMIVHYSGLDIDEALRQVGSYHSSRLMPLLFVAVAGLLGTMIMPHLSHDWEAGRHREVGRRLNTILKSLGLAQYAAAVVVLLGGPLLFQTVLSGKFTGGLEQLPLTLAYCSWFGTFAVAQNYLWCNERAGLSSLALLAGLLLNVALDLVLLPRLGLHGAVLATTAANFVALALVYLFSWRLGMQIEPATCLISALPLLLSCGPIASVGGLVVVLLAAVASKRLFTAAEKHRLARLVEGGWHKFNGLRAKCGTRAPRAAIELKN